MGNTGEERRGLGWVGWVILGRRGEERFGLGWVILGRRGEERRGEERVGLGG